MTKRLFHYLDVYRQFVAASFAQAMSFRGHFILVAIMDLLFYVSAIITADILFNTIPSMGDWNRYHFLFFVSFMLTVEHLHITFISESFWVFSDDIKTGNLDYKLLRPLGTLFTVLFSRLRPGTLFNFFVPWGLLIYYGSILELTLTKWLLLPILVLSGLSLLVLIEVLICMGMFWMIDGTALNFVRIQLQAVAKWPDILYRSFFKRLFTIAIPILLVGSAPVHFLIDSSAWALVIYMIFTMVVLWFLISIAWRLGLRRYESASS